MRRVITYGTFDLFHYGHKKLLERAKRLGDVLIVAVSTDEFNQIKGKDSYQPYSVRRIVVENSGLADYVIPETNWEQKAFDIKALNIDTLVMGDDWKDSDKFKDMPCEVVFLPRTQGIDSTELRFSLESKDGKHKLD